MAKDARDHEQVLLGLEEGRRGEVAEVVPWDVGKPEPLACRVVAPVDVVRSWRGSKGQPVQFDATLDAIAELATEFNGARVLIDQYPAEPIRQGLTWRGVHVTEAPWTNESKLDAVTATRRLLQSHLLDLPQHGELASELIGLESHPLPSGRPRIAAPPGFHDDHATALLALVANSLIGAATPPCGVWPHANRSN